MDKLFKIIIESAKDNVDFLAFVSIAAITAIALMAGVGLLQVIGLLIALCFCWIMSRYALLSIQTRERLRDLKERAKIEAQEIVTTNVKENELEILRNKETRDKKNEH